MATDTTYLTKGSSYTAIADAIRAKDGSTAALTPAQMAEAIANIPTGSEVITAVSSSVSNNKAGFKSIPKDTYLPDYNFVIVRQYIETVTRFSSNNYYTVALVKLSDTSFGTSAGNPNSNNTITIRTFSNAIKNIAYSSEEWNITVDTSSADTLESTNYNNYLLVAWK